MSDFYKDSKTVTVTEAVGENVMLVASAARRSVLSIENTGAFDIRFGFWKNLTPAPIAAPAPSEEEVDTTGSGAGILVKAGTIFTLNATANNVSQLNDDMYMVSIGGESTVNILAMQRGIVSPVPGNTAILLFKNFFLDNTTFVAENGTSNIILTENSASGFEISSFTSEDTAISTFALNKTRPYVIRIALNSAGLELINVEENEYDTASISVWCGDVPVLESVFTNGNHSFTTDTVEIYGPLSCEIRIQVKNQNFTIQNLKIETISSFIANTTTGISSVLFGALETFAFNNEFRFIYPDRVLLKPVNGDYVYDPAAQILLIDLTDCQNLEKIEFVPAGTEVILG